MSKTSTEDAFWSRVGYSSTLVAAPVFIRRSSSCADGRSLLLMPSRYVTGMNCELRAQPTMIDRCCHQEIHAIA